MTLFLCFLFFLTSYTSACCVHQSKITHASKSTAISPGACGYGSSVTSYYGPHLAASSPSLYNDGAGCGACFQIRCKDRKICTTQGTKVIVTGVNQDNKTDFVVSNRAFRSMANKGMDKAILKLNSVDVEYKRVDCQFKHNNFSIRVEESSKLPNRIAFKFLYQGGKTEILMAEVSQVGSPSWTSLSKHHGAVWDTNKAPSGPYQFRIAIIGGFDMQWFHPQLPADIKVGAVYDTGLQIDVSAADGCSPCDDGSWN